MTTIAAATNLERFTTLLGHRKGINEYALIETNLLDRFQKLNFSLATPTACVSAPSLSIDSTCNTSEHTSKEIHAKAMNIMITFQRTSVSSLPETLLNNIMLSFSNLLTTRRNQLVEALGRKVLDHKNNDITPTMQMLQTAATLADERFPTISFLYSETIFRTLPLKNGFHRQKGPTQEMVVLPFVLTINVLVQISAVKIVQARITAPGTIVGNFSNDKDKIEQANLQIDTARLFRGMQFRCDQILKKACKISYTIMQEPPEPPREHEKGHAM